MGKEYHDGLVKLIANSTSYLEVALGFKPIKIITNYHLNNGSVNNLEVDILVYGNKNRQAVVEVKSNSGLRGNYYEHQLGRYRIYFPLASQHLVYSSIIDSYELSDLIWEHVEDLKGFPEYL